MEQTANRNPRAAAAFLFLVPLCACSSHNTHLDPEPVTGVDLPVHKVAEMIDNGTLGSGTSAKLNANMPQAAPVISGGAVRDGSDSGVTRIGEQRIRIWICPYQDESGNFYEGITMHGVVTPGRWHMTPAPAAQT